MIKLIKENFYRVWYNPYLLEPDEEDFVEVTAKTADEARRRVSSKGYVTSIEEIESLTNPYDESKTKSKRNKLMEKSNFDDTEKAINYFYKSWKYDGLTFKSIYTQLKRLGHSQDFIDAVLDGITEKYEDEEDYGLDEGVEIEVKNKGILEVPEGKNVDDLPMSHFEKLVKKNGLSKITKALNNLQVWNKNDDKKLSKWAGDMIDKLTKKYGKNESVFMRKIKEDWTNKNWIISFRHNDDLEADLEEFLFDVFSDNPDVFEFDWQGKNTYLYLNCNEDNYDYIKWFIEDWKNKHRDEYDESLREDYINIDDIQYDKRKIYTGYQDLIKERKLMKLYSLLYRVSGRKDEFIIDALDDGFSKLDIIAFLMYAVGDSLSLRKIKDLFKSLNINLNESSMYDYYDTPDNAFDMHNDMSTPEDEWWASISSELRAVVHEMEEQGWEGVGFTTTGVEYCISTEDKNRPELSYEMCVTIYDRDDSVSLSKYVDIFDWDKEKEVSRIPNTSGVTEFRTPQDVKKFTQWFKRLGTSFSTKESVRVRNRKQTMDEGVAASLLTIKNQLMNKLGNAFKAVGGSMNPKVTVYSEEDPDTSFDITTDGKNVDIVPKYDGIPDTVHKKRGIAFMRAVNVLYDFIMDTLGGKGKLATENVRKRRNRRK